MKVLVCGGREYNNVAELNKSLDLLHAERGISTLVHGACCGADELAGLWAKDHGVWVDDYPIQPGEGGFARNERMLLASKPDLVVHFPGGNGTRHMMRFAMEHGVEVHGGLAGSTLPEQKLI